MPAPSFVFKRRRKRVRYSLGVTDMQIDITIDFNRDGLSKGSAVSVSEELLLICNFTVWLEGFAVHVSFADQPDESKLLFLLRKQATPMIADEYLRLCMQEGKTFPHREALACRAAARTDFASRSLLYICIDGHSEADLYGRLYTMYAENPFPFYSTPSLLLLMERIYDELNFPQSSLQHRRFRNKKVSSPEEAEKVVRNLPEQKSRPYDKTAAFIVEVSFRQYSTWQGTVTWSDGSKKQDFQSALELIRLIDSATGEDLFEQEEPMETVENEAEVWEKEKICLTESRH